MKDRYVIMARWWTGAEWEGTRKMADTARSAIGAAKLLLEEVGVYQISITDRENSPPPGPDEPEQQTLPIPGDKPHEVV